MRKFLVFGVTALALSACASGPPEGVSWSQWNGDRVDCSRTLRKAEGPQSDLVALGALGGAVGGAIAGLLAHETDEPKIDHHQFMMDCMRAKGYAITEDMTL